MINKSIVTNCDSYKVGHHRQYPENTTFITSYGESRENEYMEDFPDLVFFGMQMYLMEYLSRPVTMTDVFGAEELFNKHLGKDRFNRAGWEYIVKYHNGMLPINIRSVQEGSVMRRGNILYDVVNTDPKCFWLTSYIETSLLRAIWYPSTVASIGFHVKKMIKSFYEKTCDDFSLLDFSVHDFGARGVNTFEGAMIGGLSHLVNFKGTDTVSSLLGAMEYYSADVSAFSVDASEHSTMTIRGKDEEFTQLKYIVENNLREGSILSLVGDSYDIYRFVDKYITTDLIEFIAGSGGKLVCRPDTGIPEEIDLDLIKIISTNVGYTINSKGYAKLPPYIGLIQGDGVDFFPFKNNTIKRVLDVFEKNGFASDNIVFGSGGGLLQKVNRDIFSFAMKACHANVDGKEIDVYKEPVHSKSGKSSKRGKLNLFKDKEGCFYTENKSYNWDDVPYLNTIYLNGNILKRENFDTIKRRVEEKL